MYLADSGRWTVEVRRWKVEREHGKGCRENCANVNDRPANILLNARSSARASMSMGSFARRSVVGLSR